MACRQTKKLFEKLGKDIKEINVSLPENIIHLEALKAEGHSKMPVVQVVDTATDEIVAEWAGFVDSLVKEYAVK